MAAMANSWALVEHLVATVARAFYTDTYIIVLDALVREKYIIEEELGPRLKLSPKEVRKITTHLESEMLIKFENVYLEDNRSFIKCYYIDYNLFYNSVLYRVHLMQKAVVSEEKTELTEVFYQCPTCKEKSSSLQAMRLRSSEGKFVCSHCCPADNIRTLVSEAYYTLVEVDNRGKLNKVQLLEKKLQEQLNRSRDHEGIFNILAKLGKLTPLAHNKPSDNISNGVRSSAVMDADVEADIKQSMQFATGEFGSSLIRKSLGSATSARNMNSEGGVRRTEFNISIETEEDAALSGQQSIASDVLSRGASLHSNSANRVSNLPEFLQNSRVVGAHSIMKAAEALHYDRSGPAVEEEAPAKRARVEEVPQMAVDAGQAEGKPVAAVAEAQEEDADDVAWEEDDDVAWEDADADEAAVEE